MISENSEVRQRTDSLNFNVGEYFSSAEDSSNRSVDALMTFANIMLG